MDVHRTVVDEVMTLPEAYREALLLRFFDDLSPAEAAERLGCPVETVRSRIRRGLARVRERLDARPGAERSDWFPVLLALAGTPSGPGPSSAAATFPRWLWLGGGALGTVTVVLTALVLRDRLEGMYASYDYGAESYEPEAAQTRLAALDVEGEEPLFADALGFALFDVAPLDRLGSSALREVARATGWKTRELRPAELFGATRENGTEVFCAQVPVPAPDGDALAVLALDAQRTFAGAVVVEPDGTPVDEWQHFTSSLGFARVPRLAGARPWSDVEELRERAEKGRIDDGALIAALLELLVAMNDQASVFNIPETMRETSEVDEARMMSEAYAEVVVLAPALEPMLGEATAEFARLAEDSAARSRELAEAIRERDVEKGRAAQQRIMGNCHSCHSLPVPGGLLKDASSALRAELGVGDGFYRVGHDLRIRHPDRERMQQVADALRAGALLLDAAIPN